MDKIKSLSFDEFLKYFWEKKLFFLLWIFIILIAYFTFSSKQENKFKANYKYRFANSTTMHESYEKIYRNFNKTKEFWENSRFLLKCQHPAIKNNDISINFNRGNQVVLLSITAKDSIEIKQKIRDFVTTADSLFSKYKLTQILSEKQKIKLLLSEQENNDNLLEKQTITKNLSITLENLILDEYFFTNLSKNELKEIKIDQIEIINTVAAIIFTIWSGLMLIIIGYIIKAR